MSGRAIPLFNMREFNYNNLGVANSQETVAVRSLDVTGYREGVLEVRLHGGSVGAGASVSVILTPVAPSPEDPSKEFVETDGSVITTVSVTSSHAAPVLVLGALASDFGGWLQVSVKGQQASGSTVNMDPTLSAVLVVKE